MMTGFLLVTLAGICWIGIGVSVSICARRGWNYDIVQGINYFGAALICAALLANGAFPQADPKMLGLVFSMNCLAGVANFYTYVLTAKAMRIGPNGLIWGIMQAGMIGSTLMGIFCFGEAVAPLRMTGLFLIIGGVLAMGLAKDQKNASESKKWLIYALAAFCLVMVTHCCNALPSFIVKKVDAGSVFRTFGMYFGGFLGFVLSTLPGLIRKKQIGGKGEWITAAVMMVINTSASCFFFYRGMDLLAKAGVGGLGYPLSIGACVIGFSFYSIFLLKEKVARLGLAGLAAVCIGIITITIR